MKFGTSYFNKTLFFNLLRRFWPIFAGYFLIWLLILPIPLGNTINYAVNMGTPMNNDIRSSFAYVGDMILQLGIYGGAIMSAVFSILIAMAAFSYLYNSRSVSMMCSLPIKREGVFLSVFSSGLVGMLFTNIIIFLISLAVESAYGVPIYGPNYLFQWLAMVCMMNIFFFGFASLCATLTGNIFVLPIVFIVLNFTAYVVETLWGLIVEMFVYGVVIKASYKLVSLSPIVKILLTRSVGIPENDLDGVNSYNIGYYYDGWTSLAIYAAVGVVFAVIAMILIKNRRMETAGDVVALRPLKPVFKYCLSFGCALVIGIGIYSVAFNSIYSVYGLKSMLFMLVFMIFGAFIGYFAAEMLIHKTLRVFKMRKWIGYGVVTLVITVVMFCSEFDVLGFEKKLPDVSEVEGVSVYCAGQNSLFENPDNIALAIKLHSDIISNKDLYEKETGNFNIRNYYVTFLYTYKDGKTLEREYNIYSSLSNDIYALTDLMNVKEALDYRKKLSLPVRIDTISDAFINYFDIDDKTYKNYELTPEQAYNFYSECVIPDINDGTLGRVWFETDDNYMNSVLDCTFNMSVQQRIRVKEYKDDYFYTTITVDSERSYKWIADNLGLELSTMGESMKTQDRYYVAEKYQSY